MPAWLFLSHMSFENNRPAPLSSEQLSYVASLQQQQDKISPNNSESVDLPVFDWHLIVAASYCAVLH